MGEVREIERKFRVAEDPESWPWECLARSAAEIRQGYLTPADYHPEVRVRKAREIVPETSHLSVPRSLTDARGTMTIIKLAVKGPENAGSKDGLDRPEIELDVTAEDFSAIWRLTESRRLRKVRVSYTFRMASGEVLPVSVDFFRPPLRDLVMAEIEFVSSAAAAAFEPPPFLGSEVTHDRRYRNAALAGADRPPEYGH